jgi:hypothetical protein
MPEMIGAFHAQAPFAIPNVGIGSVVFDGSITVVFVEKFGLAKARFITSFRSRGSANFKN